MTNRSRTVRSASIAASDTGGRGRGCGAAATGPFCHPLSISAARAAIAGSKSVR